jgi:hypothetical protein
MWKRGRKTFHTGGKALAEMVLKGRPWMCKSMITQERLLLEETEKI